MTLLRRRKTLLVAASVAFAVAVSGDTAVSMAPLAALGRPGITPVACPSQAWQRDDPKFDALAGAKAFFGEYDGGVYRVEIPGTWNGELVLSAHGFVTNAGPNGSRLRVGMPGIREHLIAQGFAWAASSYRCNGYVPGNGLVDTMALTDLFATFNGGTAPRRTYLMGGSMGGHVTLLGMHEFPTAFAGGLAMCPAGPELFDFFAAAAGAAEAVAGIPLKSVSTLQQDLARITEVFGTPPSLTDKGRQVASIQIHLSGGPRPFAMDGLGSRFASNIASGAAAIAGGTSPSNRAAMTTHIRYGLDESLGLSADRLNEMVRRKAADPDVRTPMGPYEEVVPFDGKIERPLLTMHGTGDLYVPIHLQRALKRAVASAGNERLLTQRIYRIAGHCGFSVPEQERAFDDLVKWVRDGVKPQGDDVMADLRDAGRTFTTPLRPGDPGHLDVH